MIGMKTVAECVESQAEADMLKEFGVDYFQGHFFGAPEMDALAQGPCENGENKAHSAGAGA